MDDKVLGIVPMLAFHDIDGCVVTLALGLDVTVHAMPDSWVDRIRRTMWVADWMQENR